MHAPLLSSVGRRLGRHLLAGAARAGSGTPDARALSGPADGPPHAPRPEPAAAAAPVPRPGPATAAPRLPRPELAGRSAGHRLAWSVGAAELASVTTLAYSAAGYTRSGARLLGEHAPAYVGELLLRLGTVAPPTLTRLELGEREPPAGRDINFGPAWFDVLARQPLPPTLSHVRLERVDLDCGGLLALLGSAPPLQYLHLDHNPLGTAGVQALLTAPLTRLRSLSLSHVALSAGSVDELVALFDRLPQLQHLGLGGLAHRGLDPQQAERILAALPPSLRGLDLRDCALSGAPVLDVLAARTPELLCLHTSFTGPHLDGWGRLPARLERFTARLGDHGNTPARIAANACAAHLAVGDAKAVTFPEMVASCERQDAADAHGALLRPVAEQVLWL